MNNVILDSKAAASLSRSYSRLGWCGFWSQLVIGAIPLGLMIYLFLFSRATTRPRAGFVLVEYLTIGALLILAFTTIWFYRYTRLARRISDPDHRPSYRMLTRAAWTGIVASVGGILASRDHQVTNSERSAILMGIR